MNTPSQRRWSAAVVLACLIAATHSAVMQQREPPPFTPEVDDFVRTYIKTGGDKLTNWVQGETTSRPDQALRAFKPLPGLSIELVAAEPVIRQPVDVHFDDRGRLWVVQYLQYPFPAGLKVTSYDQYLRARFNAVPAAPPNHVRGADKITVLEDKDGDGRFETHRDVITGLNITTSVLTGHGGVWVMNPPYLLFYRDATGDGLPDREPEVRLEGFGLEDTHSLANSLTWGPDGWLYGVHGSTSTARVRGISFLGQAVWRYHPGTDRFELFAQGGGNPWTLSFDSSGRAFSGDNGGNSRGFHWVPGGRYVKNWPKHGPFTQPHSFGFIGSMQHSGDPARFAMTSVVYEEGKLPGYEGQLISGMALTSRMQATRFSAAGSTFRTVDTDVLVTTTDRSFRPVDTATGPDGAIYIADWCDIRMDHTDPRDTWDKSCGRIWRVRARDGSSPVPPFNLAAHTTPELVELLGDSRKWYREHARRLLGERKDKSIVPRLRQLARERHGQLALEALWTLSQISGVDTALARELLGHPDAAVRSWTLRLWAPTEPLATSDRDRLVKLATNEPDAETRSELAYVAARLERPTALGVLRELMVRQEDLSDKHVPLRIWWAVESLMTADTGAVLTWLEEADLWSAPIFLEHVAARIARRLAADRGDTQSFTRNDPDTNWQSYALHPRSLMPGGKGDYTDWRTNYTPEISDRNLTRLARFLESAPAAHRDRLLSGVKAGLEQGTAPARIPLTLSNVIGRWWTEQPQTGPLLDVAALLGHPEASKKAGAVAASRSAMPTEPSRTAAAAGASGQELFLTHCAPCHQADGAGMARLATPLRNSKWVLGQQEALIRIALNGLKTDLLMPPMGGLDDHQLAAILTYVRTAWGHQAARVSAETVRSVRAATRERQTPWTVPELAALPRRD